MKHHRMTIQEYIPGELLKPFIKAYRIVHSNEERINRVLPNTSVTIAFRLKGQLAFVDSTQRTDLPAGIINGMRKSVRLIHYAAGTTTLIILFTPTGAAAFYRQPLHELFEESVALDQIFLPSEIARVEEQLAAAANHASAVAIVEQFLLSKLINPRPDLLIQEAITRIRSQAGDLRMKALADQLYISQDAFEKRFRKSTGVSPKQFAAIVKLENLIKHKPKTSRYLDLAIDNGFYDQAHFNKEFKLFTGLTPTEFFDSASYW